jgi:ribonuclease P protein component
MVSEPAPQNSNRRFPKARHLLRRSDFERVYREGRRHFAAHMTVFYVAGVAGREPATGVRVGFAAGKALGGAVERNRLKRRLRETVRLHGFSTEVSADVVIHPKRSLAAADFFELEQEVARAFEVIERAIKKGAQQH